MLKHIKKTVACLLCSTLTLSLIGCSSVTNGKRIIRISHSQSQTHPDHLGLLAFEEYVESSQGDVQAAKQSNRAPLVGRQRSHGRDVVTYTRD